MDAIASRQPTWDQACQLQGDMFAAAAARGSLTMQLVWYRGYGEFQVEPWLTAASDQLRELLKAVAIYAVGGRQALEDFGRRQSTRIQQFTRQL